MTEQQTTGEHSFIDDIFAPTPVHSARTKLKDDFKPWHKPRKQWVRKFQWLGEIEKFVEKTKNKNDQTLRYLSLPGRDMLDVRFVHRWCEKKQINLMFLGYNDPNAPADPSDAELNLSVTELTQRDYVDRDSLVVEDKFEAIGNTKSIAYKRLVETGPFDIINLDLCNSIVGSIPLSKEDDYYKAIYELVTFQKKNRTEPWLLFLTTRSDADTVSVSASWKLFNCIEKNAKENDSFRQQLFSKLDFDCKPVTESFLRSKKYSGIGYRNLVGLGFGKWFLGLLFGGQPKWCLKMLDSVEYLVRPSNPSPDMLSLAFECSMIIEPPKDNAGFTSIFRNEQSAIMSEGDFALGLIDAVKMIKNIDSTLADDKNLKYSLINEAVELMVDAHFDGEKFRAWAEAF